MECSKSLLKDYVNDNCPVISKFTFKNHTRCTRTSEDQKSKRENDLERERE